MAPDQASRQEATTQSPQPERSYTQSPELLAHATALMPVQKVKSYGERAPMLA